MPKMPGIPQAFCHAIHKAPMTPMILTITDEDGATVVSAQLPAGVDPFTATTTVLNALAAMPKKRTRRRKDQTVTVR